MRGCSGKSDAEEVNKKKKREKKKGKAGQLWYF